jgi:hypothetical protein
MKALQDERLKLQKTLFKRIRASKAMKGNKINALTRSLTQRTLDSFYNEHGVEEEDLSFNVAKYELKQDPEY